MRNFTIVLCVLLAGCASFKTKQTDETTTNPDGTETRKITTEAAAGTFAAGKSALANWKATQTDKSQGASVGSLSQESDAAGVLKVGTDGVLKFVKP